mgnify:CR=1 FL=1
MAQISIADHERLFGPTPTPTEDKPVETTPSVIVPRGSITQAQHNAMMLTPTYDQDDPTKPIGSWSLGPGGIPRGFGRRLGEIFGEGTEAIGKLTRIESLERYGGNVIDTFREKYGYRADPTRSWETAKKEFGKGNPFPMFMFMWETTPESIAYLPYVASPIGRLFAVTSETNRIAKQRATNDGRTEDELTPSDYAYAFPSAVVNIAGEYIAGIRPLKRALAGRLTKKGVARTGLEIIGKESGIEFIQGGTEEVMSTIDTETGLNVGTVIDQAAAEAVGAGGHGIFTAVTSGVLNARMRKKVSERIVDDLVSTGSTDLDPTILNKDLIEATRESEEGVRNVLTNVLKDYETEVGALGARTDPTTIVEGSRDLPGYDRYQSAIQNILRRAFGTETVDLFVAVDSEQREAIEGGAELDRAFIGSAVSHGVTPERGQSVVQVTVPIDNIVMRGDPARQQFAVTPAGMTLKVTEVAPTRPIIDRDVRPVLSAAERTRVELTREEEKDVLFEEFESGRAEGLAARSAEKSAEKATKLARRLARKVLDRLPSKEELLDEKLVSATRLAQIIRKRLLPSGGKLRGQVTGGKANSLEIVRNYRNALERPNQIGAINKALAPMGYRLVRKGKDKALHFEPISFEAEELANSGVGSTRVQDRLIDDYYELLDSKVKESKETAARRKTRAKKLTAAEREAEKERSRVVPENVTEAVESLEGEFVTREAGKKVAVDWDGLRARVQKLKDEAGWNKKERKAIDDYVASLETEYKLGRRTTAGRTITVGFLPSSSVFNKLRKLTGKAFEAFHRDAHRIITSPTGKDLLLGKIAGIYVKQVKGVLRVAGTRNPMAVLTLSPKADQGKIARLYALASMYIYRTDSVSMSMPESELDVEIETTDVGAIIRFKNPIGNRENLFLGELNKAFGNKVGYTVLSPSGTPIRSVSVFNAGLSKTEFARILGKFYGRTKTKYGYQAEIYTTTSQEVTHNWNEDPTGESIRDEFREAGFGDLLTYLDDRREAFDKVAEKYGVTPPDLTTPLESPLVVSTTDREGKPIRTAAQRELFDSEKALDEPYPKTREEASTRATNFLERAVRRLGGSVLGNQISREYKDTGQVSLIGKTAANSEELAILAQIYRNPMFETTRYFFFDKNNKIVAQTGVSARNPVSTTLTPGRRDMSTGEVVEQLRDLITNAKAQGAVSFTFIHNHPGGNPRPSKEDIGVVNNFNTLSQMLHIKMRDSIVLDQSTYAVIPHNVAGHFSQDYQRAAFAIGQDLRTLPKESRNIFRGGKRFRIKDHPLLGKDIIDTRDLAQAGVRLMRDSNQVVLISMNANGKLAGIMELPVEAFVGEPTPGRNDRNAIVPNTSLPQIPLNKQQKLRVTATLRSFLRSTGGAGIIAFNYPTTDSNLLAFRKLDGGLRSESQRKRILKSGVTLLDSTKLFRRVVDQHGEQHKIKPQQALDWKSFSVGGGVEIIKWTFKEGTTQIEGPSEESRNFILRQVDQYKTLQHSDYNQLAPELKKIVDRRIDAQDNPERTRKALQDNAGTPWVKQAIEGAIMRDAMDYLIRGEQPPYINMFDYDNPRIQTLRKGIEDKGAEAVWEDLERVGMVGSASKPVNSVNSSFLNCEPSKNCAKFCYATGGHYRQANVILKGELTDWAVQTDPVRAAKLVAKHYSSTPEFSTGKALRIFDKGDGNDNWVTFIKTLNETVTDGMPVRVQVFSKHPEFLRKVPKMNLRLLSIDESNLQLAIDNPDLGLSYVYEGTEADVKFLEENEERFTKQGGVILPVVLGKKLLGAKETNLLPRWTRKYTCPIDNDIKKIGKKGNEWNCTKCDKMAGLGCYHGQVTTTILDTIKRARSTPYAQQIEENIASLTGVSKDLGPEGGPELLAELDTLLGLAQGRTDTATEIESGFEIESPTEAIVIPPPKAAIVETFRPASGGLPSSGVRTALGKEFGDENVAYLEREGILTIVDSVNDLSPELQQKAKEAEAVYGMYDPATNKGYLFSNKLTAEGAAQMFMHEIGVHYSLPRVLGAEGYADIITELINNKNGQFSPYFAQVRGAYKEHAEDSVEQVEEVIALMVQDRNAHRFPIVEKIFLEIRKFVRENLPVNIKLTQRDIQYLVRGAVDKTVKGDVVRIYDFNGEVAAAKFKKTGKRRGGFPVEPITEPETILPRHAAAGASTASMNRMRDAVKRIYDELGLKEKGVRIHFPKPATGMKSSYVLLNNDEFGELIIRSSNHPIEPGASVGYIPIVDFSDDPTSPLAIDAKQIRKAMTMLANKEFDGVKNAKDPVNQKPNLMHHADFWMRYRLGDAPADINRELATKVETWPEYMRLLSKQNNTAASILFENEHDAVQMGLVTDVNTAYGQLTGARYSNANKEWNDRGILTYKKLVRFREDRQRKEETKEEKQRTEVERKWRRLDPSVRGAAIPPDLASHSGLDAEDIAILNEVAATPRRKSLWSHLEEWRHEGGQKLVQGVVDAYRPIANKLGNDGTRAWQMMHLSDNAHGLLHAMLHFGKPQENYRDGEFDWYGLDTTQQEGIIPILSELSGETDKFFAWVIGNRANKLSKPTKEFPEGREHYYTRDQIDRMMRFNKGELADGRSRALVYAQTMRKLSEYQTSVLDIATNAGVINDELRAEMETDFYVPFYREFEAKGKELIRGPSISSDFVNMKDVIHKLRGSELKTHDVLHNVLMNWHALLGASMKNRAGVAALDAAVKAGAAVNLYDKFYAEIQAANPSLSAAQIKGKANKEVAKVAFGRKHAKDSTYENFAYVLRNGERIWYEVNDPLVMNSLVHLNWGGSDGKTIRVLSKFKRAFTVGVTANPIFKIRNLIRDTVHSVAVGKGSVDIFGNVYKGIRATKLGDPIYSDMLAGGGAFSFGFLNDDPSAIRRLINLGVKDSSILNTDEKIKSTLRKGWDYWGEVGNRMENANRAALYMKRRGEVGHLQASFEARDLLNFSSHGSWYLSQLLMSALPFANARLQGIDKLARSVKYKDQRARFLAVTGTVVLASVGYALLMKDDEDYKELPEWVKDTYWPIKIPGTHSFVYLPKPFEIGAIASLGERLTMQFVNSQQKFWGKNNTASRMAQIVMDQLAFDLRPQIIRPVIEVARNYDSFMDRRIESWSWERLPDHMKYHSTTSDFARTATETMDNFLPADMVLSPVQIDHLIEGYFGWLGAVTVGAMDTVMIEPARQLAGEDRPPRPTKRLDEFDWLGPLPLSLRSVVSVGPRKNIKQMELFYEQMREINLVSAAYNKYKRDGLYDEARKVLVENGELLKWRSTYSRMESLLGKIGKQKQHILNDMNKNPMQKRKELDELYEYRNKAVKDLMDLRDSVENQAGSPPEVNE